MTTWEEVLRGFAARLRREGLAMPPDRVAVMLRAVALVNPLDRAQVAAATRASCCAGLDDVRRHDAVFAAYFGPAGPPSLPLTVEVERAAGGEGSAGEPGQGTPREAAHHAELLKGRPSVVLDRTERAEATAMAAALRAAPPRRRARRTADGGHRMATRRTVRAMLRHGGEPVRLRRHHPRERARRVVAVIDVSGSMKPWADLNLRFGHALHQAYAAEVFTLATRLTRITPWLRNPDVDAALAEVSRRLPDWTGGTRLSDGLDELVLGWGRRGPLRGAVVVVVSDGLERGDPAGLREATARLARLAHRIVWVHPRAGAEGWVPATRGLAAVNPFVVAFAPGGDAAALGALGPVLAARRGETGTHRSGREQQHA